jgi:hypothetical protein
MKSNGAADYFLETEQDQNMLVRLGSQRIPYHIVIAAASVAFKECGYSKDLLGKTAIEWDTKAGADLDDPKTYKAFMNHWNESLKLICLHSDIPKGKANKAEDVSSIVQNAMESALAAQASAYDELNQFILGEQLSISRRMDDL